MDRSVVITGLGPISGLGLGMARTWQAALDGTCAIGPVRRFDAGGFACRLASEVRDFNARQVVPKSYRKAVKVMARDIELAVGAADEAARDAALVTRGTAGKADLDEHERTYPPERMGAHIGAALIAAELDELTFALAKATDDRGRFDYHKFGTEGLNHVTPLWLLKYLPNMLACHVTIIHDTQGPSNTITCNEASSHLSIGESLRVIQRGAADMCFCGGVESKIDLMGHLRRNLSGRLNTTDNDRPGQAVRPFCRTAAGTVPGEGGAIVILEAEQTFQARRDKAGAARAYARLKGFGASQTVHLPTRNLEPDPQGRGIAAAIGAALADADIQPQQIDMIVPFGLAVPAYDRAEAEALHSVFGGYLANIPIVAPKALTGILGAGSGALDTCIAAQALAEQTIPARVNCAEPLPGLNAGNAPAQPAELRYVLTCSTSFGGQNAALVLARVEP